MSLFKGSLTYVRLFVEGELPRDFRDRFTKALRLRAMRPLEPEEDDVERSGWAVCADPFDTDLRYDNVFYNEYLNLSFRTDKWAIPGSMLKASLRDAEAALLTKKGREHLSRAEKTELKELVSKKLRKKLMPVTRAIDLSWSLDEQAIRFFSHSERTITAMVELFERTFDLELAHEAPYTLAARLGLTQEQEAAWDGLEMIDLAVGQA